jgi:phage terminase large subunit-like protein
VWDLSCRDWQDRIRAGRSLLPELPLFRAEADLAVAFFNGLHLPDVPDKPVLRDAAGDWFRDIVAALFGARDPETNIRHIREVFGLVPKGNSKTSYGAGLMLTALLMNVRPRAEYLFVGPTQAIADIALSQAIGMVEADEALKARFQVREHIKEIRDRTNNAKLKVKTFDLDILTGPKPVGVLLDELHLLGKNAATTKVLRQIRGGLEKNTEGFLVIITTQSDEPPAGSFRDELLMARKIRDGVMAGRMLPVLYEFPEDIARDPAKWQVPSTWPMVNPNLGRSIQLDSLTHDWESERTKGEHAVRIWASQHVNIEIGLGLKTDRWAGADYWERRALPALTLEALLARSEVAVVGIDGGGLDDLLGLAVIGRDAVTRDWLLWCRAWAHNVVLERRKSEAALLQDLARAGELVLVERLGQDVTEVADIVEQVLKSGLLPEKNAIGLDPVGIGQIVDELAAREISTERIVGVSQGWKLSGAIKTAERKLADGTLFHADTALMNWCVGNARIEPKGNALTITKQAAGAGKIDPLMASFNAVALMSMNPTVSAPYADGRDLLVL